MSLQETVRIDTICPHCTGNIRILLTEKQLRMLLKKVISRKGRSLRTDQLEKILRKENT